MSNKLLITILIVIAISIWSKNIFTLINKNTMHNTDTIVEISNDNSDYYQNLKTYVLEFKYNNPFITTKPKKETKKDIKKKVLQKPFFKIIGISDKAAVIQTKDGSIFVMRKPEKIFNYTIKSIGKNGLSIVDENGNIFHYKLSSTDND